ncbi:hypothetical protein SLE2022_096150 [Rubroshorea leprosula]
MATENSGSKSSSTADSYIGSLISLTSKSEIRYEGVLYNINTEESSIGLRNVRSFGTEGRKKDGPQVPPSDKVYEYILFRGSDIKDLQVKSSPPVQPAAPITNDPAIIQHSQSHYPRPVSTSTSLPSTASGPLTDLTSLNSQMGLPGSNFQGSLPLYQPGGNLGSWGASPPPPSANGSGLAMPMYWQGYYGPPNGLTHLHQQSLLRPPPGLSMPPSLQPMQYPNFNVPLPTGPSNLQSSIVPEVPSALLPVTTISGNLTSTPLPSLTLPSSLPSTLPPAPSASLASETLPGLLPNKAPSSALPTAAPGASLPSLSPLTTSTPELNPAIPIANKPNVISGPTLSYQSTSQSASSILGTSTSVRAEAPTPSLVTPGQLLQSGSTVAPSSQSSITAQKDVEVVEASASPSSEPSAPVAKEAQPPILPLPVPSRAIHKPNGPSFQARHGYRGRERGRGTGNSRPVTKFTEDFDFMAMNEKFNKDEVWGHLGKSNKSHSKDNEGDVSDEDGSQDEYDAELPKIDVKPMYNKDDFFDTLSCNALDNNSQSGRPRFSDQMKIDTETFGDFSRHRGGRGGRGPRGGRSRGGYYGRGYGNYGYISRGRGRAMSSRPS